MTPARLTDERIAELAAREDWKRSWSVQSLLLTLYDEREEHEEECVLLRAEVGQLRNSIRWFETTYSTRPLAPLLRKRGGLKCCRCGKREAVKVGIHWACFACHKTWSDETTTIPIGENEPHDQAS